MEKELKPCPFCGSKSELYTRYDSFENAAECKSEIPKNAKIICEKKYPGRNRVYVYKKILYIPRCTVSSCMGRNIKGFEIKEESIEAWNRRSENGSE